MTKLKLGPIPDDKPVKLTVELPVELHQRRKTAQRNREQGSGSAHEIARRNQPVCVIKARKI